MSFVYQMKTSFNSTTLANIATIVACGVIVATFARGFRSANSPASPGVEQVTGLLTAHIPATTVRGNPHAPVVMIEFSDFECPACGHFARETLPLIQKEYVDTGKVSYAYRHFPLMGVHPFASGAAIAAQCAAEQQQFWPMHDRMIANQLALTPDVFKGYARALDFDEQGFSNCLQSSPTFLTRDLAEGRTLGVRMTPTFVIGVMQADGTVRVASKILGSHSIDIFRRTLADASHSASQFQRS
jgi:protein-disulfide isomerase